MAFWAAFAPILAQAGSDLLNNVLGYFSNKEANQMSYDQSVKLWQMNNNYNTPVNQMKRLEDAGLNPYLVYGNGAVGNTSAQPSSPSVQGNKFHVNLLSGIMAKKQLDVMDEQLDTIKKKNELLDFQLGNLQFYRRTGLPLNSPWYAAWLMDVISNPEKVNKLKQIGLNIGNFIGDIMASQKSAPSLPGGRELDVEYGFLPGNARLNVDDSGNFILE